MNFSRFVKEKHRELAGLHINYPENGIWELVEICTGYNKQDLLILDSPENFNEENFLLDFNKFFLRLKGGEPLQYITGRAYFRSLELEVSDSVLIPRPETEMLVDIAKEYLKSATIEAESALIGDICTGSGCIAISVAKEIGASVYATDISNECIEIASNNACLNGAEEKCKFLCGNLCEPLMSFEGRFDCILSNPPYVPETVYDTLLRTVKNFEPKIALIAGEDGCEYMNDLCIGAFRLLKYGGLFACEVFDGNSNDFKDIVERVGFSGSEIVNDLAGKPRFVVAYKI